jgi:LPS export ABC transporter permease LptG/LPS export ABC transporter permease LptF
MNLLDRYVLRQVFWPLAMALVAFTFLLMIPTLMLYAEDYFRKGVSPLVFLRLAVALVPMALATTIPISLLLGLLVGFGRLSADREFVALQACGVSLRRLLRPVTLAAALCAISCAYVYMVLIPEGNQSFREITFTVLARAGGDVQPRVFNHDFPDVVFYAEETAPDGGLDGVFLADARAADDQAVWTAHHARFAIDETRRTVELVLEDGARHAGDRQGNYDLEVFQRQVLQLNPDTMFPNQGPAKGDREMSLGELRAKIATVRADGGDPRFQVFEFHKRFSIPAACLVFALIGLALGVTNRRDGALASFAIGVVVIFAYWALLTFGESLVVGAWAGPGLAAWLPNLILGALGVALLRWRSRMADRPLSLPWLESLWRRLVRPASVGASRLPVSILDRYVTRIYLRILGLSVAGMALLFYVSAFVELSEKVFQGNGTWAMLGAFLWYSTPHYLYFVIPLSVLLATLVTVAVLTKNSEIVVIRACGVSLYRTALPMVVAAITAGAGLFGLDQTVLGPANRKAEALDGAMRGSALGRLNRQWVAGRDGTIYQFAYFDPDRERFVDLRTYELDDDRGLTRRTYAEQAAHLDADRWRVERGWTRTFTATGDPGEFQPFAAAERVLERPELFSTEPPDPDFMSFTQLRAFTERLAESGFDVVSQRVALWRKVSFPFVTLVMTLIAVPFAVTIGRGGALAGIGIGIAIALGYWGTILVFSAMGAAGVLSPPLAAWAPHVLFGTAALYLLLSVRT